MNFFSNQGPGFGKYFRSGILLFVALCPAVAFGQTPKTKIRGFWVAGSASVSVKADEAIVFMVIRTSAMTAADALSRNDATSTQVEESLDKLGLSGKYRFSAPHFDSGATPALAIPRAPVFGPYNPRVFQRRPCGYEVTKYVFVTFDESDLSNPLFDQVLAGAIDGLASAGAQQPEISPQVAPSEKIGAVLFTVKDPGPAQLEAIHQAAERARALGEEVAKNSGVKITGILDARVNRPLEVALPRQQELSVLDELHLRYYATSRDAITIPATFAVEYSAK
ncbi:MAG: SIMPL domain-containing protein [Candidatus Acidiferrales bacterium]